MAVHPTWKKENISAEKDFSLLLIIKLLQNDRNFPKCVHNNSLFLNSSLKMHFCAVEVS